MLNKELDLEIEGFEKWREEIEVSLDKLRVLKVRTDDEKERGNLEEEMEYVSSRIIWIIEEIWRLKDIRAKQEDVARRLGEGEDAFDLF